jgi:hypothetical protein
MKNQSTAPALYYWSQTREAADKLATWAYNSLHSHPTGNWEKCWLDRLALPQGRDEKKHNQANTQPI